MADDKAVNNRFFEEICVTGHHYPRMGMKPTTLTFSFLDDLLRATESKGLDCSPYLATAPVERIGPLVELLVYHGARQAGFEALPKIGAVRALSEALTARASLSGTHFLSNGSSVGFVLTRRDWIECRADKSVCWGRPGAECNRCAKRIASGPQHADPIMRSCRHSRWNWRTTTKGRMR